MLIEAQNEFEENSSISLSATHILNFKIYYVYTFVLSQMTRRRNF